MSVFRRVTALLAAMVLAAGLGAAQAQTITARVGNAFGRAGAYGYVDVPITVDMRGAPGVRLGSYRMDVRWDPRVLTLQDGQLGDFAMPVANDDSIPAGKIRLTAIQPSGAQGVVTLIVLRFTVVTDTLAAAITLSFDEMSAAGTFANLLPYLTVQSGTFCRAQGTWGDADFDGRANSRDALIALSQVVGVLRARDTIRVDTIPIDSGRIRIDTIATVRPSLADVDADGAVTSRDALIIMTYAVGLPMDAFRIGQPAAGACSATGRVTLSVSPDTLELQSGQYGLVTVAARDASGRPLPATSVVWRSSNGAVATYVYEDMMPAIFGRDPGVATLTAELSPGLQASIVVKVVARRVHWYVDAIKATNVLTQTGSPRHPLAFIGEAVDYAQDGDTIHVAPGNYEETIDRWVSVAILGNAANRPVIDARLSPAYASSPLETRALRLGSLAGQVTLQDIRIVGGAVLVAAHDLAVRNVRVEAPDARDVFMFAGPMQPGPGDAPAALRPVAADVPIEHAGKAFIDGLHVAGYQETAIVAMYVDTAIIRNSSAVRDAIGPSSGDCYPTSMRYVGIGAFYVGSLTELRADTVAEAACAGIHVIQGAGRAVLSRNRVLGARAGGIVVSADTVELDHNLVRDVPSSSEYPAVGIGVAADAPVRSVTSLGDTVINVGQRGFAVDTALVGTIDSLVVDSTDLDFYASPGVSLRGGHFTLRHSHVSHGWEENAVTVCGWNATLTSRGNRITNPGYNGISVWDCTYSANGPDSLISVSDTVVGPFTYDATGIRAADALFASVDSAVVFGSTPDTALADRAMGVGFSSVRRGILRDAKIRDLYWDGAYGDYSDTLLFERDSVTNTGSGFWFNDNSDTVRVRRSVVQNTQSDGVGMEFNTVLRMDTSVVIGGGSSGVFFDYGSGGRITGSRLENNHRFGVYVSASNGSTSSVGLRGNSLAANDSGGVSSTLTPVDADSNWWGRPEGPMRVADAVDTYSVVGAPVVFDLLLLSMPSLPTLVLPLRGPVSAVAVSDEGGRRASGGTHERRGRGEGAGTQAGGPPASRSARSALAPSATLGAEARIRESLAQPSQPWQLGRPSNQPAPRHN